MALSKGMKIGLGFGILALVSVAGYLGWQKWGKVSTQPVSNKLTPEQKVVKNEALVTRGVVPPEGIQTIVNSPVRKLITKTGNIVPSLRSLPSEELMTLYTYAKTPTVSLESEVNRITAKIV